MRNKLILAALIFILSIGLLAAGFHLGMSACMRYCVMFDGSLGDLIEEPIGPEKGKDLI